MVYLKILLEFKWKKKVELNEIQKYSMYPKEGRKGETEGKESDGTNGKQTKKW